MARLEASKNEPKGQEATEASEAAPTNGAWSEKGGKPVEERPPPQKELLLNVGALGTELRCG